MQRAQLLPQAPHQASRADPGTEEGRISRGESKEAVLFEYVSMTDPATALATKEDFAVLIEMMEKMRIGFELGENCSNEIQETIKEWKKKNGIPH